MMILLFIVIIRCCALSNPTIHQFKSISVLLAINIIGLLITFLQATTKNETKFLGWHVRPFTFDNIEGIT